MAEPLSIVASVATLADLAFKTVKLLNEVEDGGRQRDAFSREARSLHVVLASTEAHVKTAVYSSQDAPWIEELRKLQDSGGLFEHARRALQGLNDILQPRTGAKKIVQSLRWPLLEKNKVESILQSTERLRQSMSLILNQANNTLEQETNSIIKEIKKDSNVIRGALESQDINTLLEWLSTSNHLQKQAALLKQTRQGTGNWFLESSTFKAWKETAQSTLWCPGIPGAGKTFLSSICVQHLRDTHAEQNCLVLVAYCSYDEVQTQSVDSILSGLLKEAIQITRSINQQMLASFQKHRHQETRPTCAELLAHLHNIFTPFWKVFILLDALDEISNDRTRKDLLRNVWGLGGNINTMTTSRDLPDIRQQFSPSNDASVEKTGAHTVVDDRHPALCIEIQAANEDLESYVKLRLNQSVSLGKKPGLDRQIVDKVIELAKGRFLLAKFHMDTLSNLHRPSLVMKALEGLPSRIDRTYDQAMQRISDASQFKAEAMNFISWVVYAYRPLSVREIEHATATLAGQRDFEADDVINADVLCSWCAGLVVIDAGFVKLVHWTAQDYFEDSKRKWFPNAPTSLPRNCLTYLLFDAFLEGPCSGDDESSAIERRGKEFPLLGYASVYWGRHLRDSPGSDLEEIAMEFLLSRPHRATAAQMLWYAAARDAATWEAKYSASSLHLASFFGLESIVSQLLELGHNPNIQDSVGVTPLMYASTQGYCNVVARLLQADAHINEKCHRGITSLHRAILHNHARVVEVLLGYKELDVNAIETSLSNLTPFILAINNGLHGIVEQLLTRQDISLVSEDKVAFVWAAFLGQLEVVKVMLRDPRVDINKPDRHDRTALRDASCEGHVEIVKVLLAAGADPEKKDFNGGTPLLRAIDCDRVTVVVVLLRYGVNLHTPDLFGRTLVHGAAINNRYVISRLLLDHSAGIDINAQGHDGRTALHDTAYEGHIEAAKILLEYGARTDLRDNSGQTPLDVARKCWHLSVCDLLSLAESKQLDVTRKPESTALGRRPLWLEAKLGNSETVIKMVMKGKSQPTFNIDEQHPFTHQTALHFATMDRNLATMSTLLAAGANINHRDNNGQTPLHLVIRDNEAGVRDLLLANGADVGAKNNGGDEVVALAEDLQMWETAVVFVQHGATSPDFIHSRPRRGFRHETLCAAATMGNTEAVRNLIRAGVNTQKKDDAGMTPFQLAKRSGHEETAMVLLDRLSCCERPGGMRDAG